MPPKISSPDAQPLGGEGPRVDGRRRPAFGPLVCVASTNVDSLVEALRADGIVASSRVGNLRIALHLYNVDEDVDLILAALAANRGLLAEPGA